MFILWASIPFTVVQILRVVYVVTTSVLSIVRFWQLLICLWHLWKHQVLAVILVLLFLPKHMKVRILLFIVITSLFLFTFILNYFWFFLLISFRLLLFVLSLPIVISLNADINHGRVSTERRCFIGKNLYVQSLTFWLS